MIVVELATLSRSDVNKHSFQLEENGQFSIEDYQNIRPFSSFLPGIAGPMGVPLWVFYVNRGQAIASFGAENKDNPILEFQPANRAYQLTAYLGFRTFIRMRRGNKQVFYEPFSPGSSSKMVIGTNELRLQEINHLHGLQTDVIYFQLPGENLACLVRMVTVTNQSDRPVILEMLDGLPAVIPFGVNNQMLKDIGRTVEAWMEVYNLEKNIPYYRLRASVADTTEVSLFEAGHFMLAFQVGTDEPRILPAIVDLTLVFGQNTAINKPDAFCQKGLTKLLSQKQITCGRTPCGFAASQVELGPGESVKINSLYGHISRLENIQSQIKHFTSATYLDDKRREANDLVRNLTEVISCRTSSRTFDAYCRQTFLDNILRGGWPIVFGKVKESAVYHIYSRKHGDLERDYNAFSFAPEFYSQGNGSYRDVNQNRREDVWFNPSIGDFDIRVFMSLVQADGYNPLVVLGSRFTILPKKLEGLLSLAKEPGKLHRLLSRSFSPGSLLREIVNESICLRVEIQAFLEKVIENSEQHIEASDGEGYWIDHWTYNLDLIESYLVVFPERQRELLFSSNDLPFYDSPVIVQPRSRKYILVNGQPRQLGSLVEDQQKSALIAARGEYPRWLRTGHGAGEIYRTNLFAKLISLALIKFATIDPWGMGIEMEAGRPAWNDAMNGLPGLFGSSMPETYALKRLVKFLRSSLQTEGSGRLRLPVEMMRLLRRVVKELKIYQSAIPDKRDYQYWDHVSSAREAYRASVRMGLDGAEEESSFTELETILGLFETKIDSGIARALELNNGLPPTYFTYRVEEFDLLKDKQGCQQSDPQGRPYIRARRFTPRPLPLFLEGMVRAMKIMDTASAEHLYKKVKESSLYDRKLKMYKINASLEDLPMDIGRVRAFTPGWLENESIWLHMEYKYLLEILRAGLYEHFFEDFRTALIPFLDPKVYGRSPLENSSFLVSSAHPDEKLHGAGFIARLSGASAEFLSMWRQMMAGVRPFFVQADQLCLAFKPILPSWLFDEDSTISFKFLGQTMVIYHNPEQRNTYDIRTVIDSIILHPFDGGSLELPCGVIPAPYAQQIRDGQVKQIDVYFA
jgi:hypothetical protein